MPVENLFNIIYSGYTTPLEAQQLKAQVSIKQTEAQLGLVELAKQKATMGVMDKIWGVGGPESDPDNKQKLNMTAAYLMRAGDVGQATNVLSRVASINEREAVTRKDAIEAEAKKRQDLSATAGAVNDQATYSAAFPSLIENLGPQAQQLKLTGVYEQDKSKLDFLSKSGATWAQKQTVAETQQRDSNNYMFKSLGADLAQQKFKNAQGRTELLRRAADRADAGQKERFEEDARRDERLKNGLKGDPAKDYARNLTVSKREDGMAQSSFSLDPRTANMDPNMQAQYAKLAAGRAKELVANKLRDDPKADISYDATLSEVMDQMESEGLFKPTGTTWGGDPIYKYQEPSFAKGTGQGTPPKGQASKPAPPAGTYPTADGVAKAYKAGKLTRDQAAELLKKNGWAQ